MTTRRLCPSKVAHSIEASAGGPRVVRYRATLQLPSTFDLRKSYAILRLYLPPLLHSYRIIPTLLRGYSTPYPPTLLGKEIDTQSVLD
jgi:hypothetical protein